MEDAESDPTITTAGSTTWGAINTNAEQEKASTASAKKDARERRQKVTLERILDQTTKVLSPYQIEFGEVDWWVR